MDTNTLTCAVECRASESGPVLRGVVLTEGRAAAGGRAELFVAGACDWPASGIGIGVEHLRTVETRAVPVRDGAEIRVECPATPAIFAAVNGGARFMSIEFHPLAETRTAAGVREVTAALLVGAIVCREPEYAPNRGGGSDCCAPAALVDGPMTFEDSLCGDYSPPPR